MKYHIQGSGGMTPQIIDFSIRWKPEVSFITRPIYSQANSPQYPMDRWFGGPKRCSAHGGKKKSSFHCPCQESNPSHSICSTFQFSSCKIPSSVWESSITQNTPSGREICCPVYHSAWKGEAILVFLSFFLLCSYQTNFSFVMSPFNVAISYWHPPQNKRK